MNDTKDILNNQNEVTQGEENSIIHKEEYTIYNYFKDHPAFLVAFFSGLVAAISFVFNYCIGQYYMSYLSYWNIDEIFAASSNDKQIQPVFNAFSFLLVITITQMFMGTTVEAYLDYKTENKLNHKSKKGYHRFNVKSIKQIISRKKNEKKDNTIEGTDSRESTENTKKRVLNNVVASIVFLFFIGFIFALPFINTMYEKFSSPLEKFFLSLLVLLIIIVVVTAVNVVLLIFSVNKQKKNYVDRNELGTARDDIVKKRKQFPLEILLADDCKAIVSDTVLKALLFAIAIPTIMLTFVYPFNGSLDAAEKRNFPIIVDDEGMYAVIYNSGEALVLEQATINDGTIVVDTTKQRIIRSNDISYEVSHFNNVYIRDNDNNG